jgi:hypothetical protein
VQECDAGAEVGTGMNAERQPKTNEAIRAAVRSWWGSSMQVANREREAASWARFGTVPTTYEESLRPFAVVGLARARGHSPTLARVLAAARAWDETGLDCDDGLTATLRKVGDDWRIVVTGPLGAV